MRKPLALVVLIAAAALVGFWLTQKSDTPSAATPASPESRSATASAAATPMPDAPAPPLAPRLPGASADAPLVRTPADTTHPTPAAPPPPVTAESAASPDIRTDLEEVLTALRDFRNNLGGNPVGTNAEITKTLLGDNLKQIKVPIPTGSRVNARGELCDRWGTPYFFHQLSRDKMEVRSAGPDRQMWTADDRQM